MAKGEAGCLPRPLQRRWNRFFLDNAHAWYFFIVLVVLVTLICLGVAHAMKVKATYNDDLGVQFTELVSLKRLVETERTETQQIARQLNEATLEVQAKQESYEAYQQSITATRNKLEDVQNALSTRKGRRPAPEVKAPVPIKEEVPLHLQTPTDNKKPLTAPIVAKEAPSQATGIDHERREAVKEAFVHAWSSYKHYAWGKDDVKPVSKTYTNWLDLAVTMVDSLDTLWIMDLKEDFAMARDWIAQNLSFERNLDNSLFETTIRELGGLLSAYELSKDKMFLDKAEDIGKRLLMGFSDPSGIPHAAINLATGRASSPGWIYDKSILSEMGTLQLEFLYLAYHTNNPEYSRKPMEVFRHLDSLQKEDGLYPLYVSRVNGQFVGRDISFGALGDSFYEYMLKLWLFTGKEADGYRRMYEESSTGAIKHLVLTSPSGYRYLAQRDAGGGLVTKMEHLTCFAGGMFALGAQNRAVKGKETAHQAVGADLTSSCHQSYLRTATGIGPETFEFHGSAEFVVPDRSRYYILRPETVESYFVLWRTTKDPKYREWAWEAFQAIQKHCRVEGGFSGIHNVDQVPVQHDDNQQSFFLAETLKYLYLIFSEDELIPLDKYVFNTEAHPLGIPDESISTWPQELQFQLLMS